MKPLLTLPALLLLAAAAAHAQPGDAPARTITGKVFDALTGAPLQGTTIRVHISAGDSLTPTTYGAIALADGSFSVRAPRDMQVVLEASYVGYVAARLEPGTDGDSVEFNLEQSTQLESAVQVTALRRTRSVEDACCRVESIREEVQQHAPFSPGVVDVLSRYSSCTSTRISCAIDNSSSIRLRGLEPTYIKVLVDGMPAFNGLATFYGLSMVPAHALQTIRISEGASSSRYGNGAISGVVDLETRPPTEIPEISISANASGHTVFPPSEGDLNLSYTGMIGPVGLAAFGSLNAHTTNGEPGEIERDYNRASAFLKGNIMLDNVTELILSGLLGHEKREGSHVLGPAGIHDERVELGRSDITLKLARTLNEDSEVSVAGFLSSQNIEANYGGQRLDAQQQTMHFNLLYTRSFGDDLLQMGTEVFRDKFTNRTDLDIDYEIGIPAFMGQYEMMFSDEWTAMASLRVDHHSSAGTIVSPRGSLKYSPVASMHMRLMAGQGFKGEALFNEDHLVLHGAYRWLPNPGYGFERSFTLNYDISYSFLMGDDAGLDANFNAYYTTIRGKAVPNARLLAEGSLFYENSSEPARLTGLELQLRPTFGDHWSGSFALALISYQMREGNVYQQIPLAPRSNIDASVMFNDEEIGVTAEAWGSYIGAQKLPLNPYFVDESKPYMLVNLRAEKKFGPVAIFAGILNVLNTLQTDTMPLSFETGNTENAGVVWGPIEGREMFFGARYIWSGAEE